MPSKYSPRDISFVDLSETETVTRSAEAARRKEVLQLIADIRPSDLSEHQWLEIIHFVEKNRVKQS